MLPPPPLSLSSRARAILTHPQREPLSTSFNCLFCNHEDAVTCKLDKKAGIGSLSCKICGQHFQSNINCNSPTPPHTRRARACPLRLPLADPLLLHTDLSHAVDVYSEWIDACDEIANPKPAKARGAGADAGGSSSRRERERASQREADDEEDDEALQLPRGDKNRERDRDDGDLSDLEDIDEEYENSNTRSRGARIVDDDEDDDEDDM